jgi:hypothetical protein
MSSPGKKQFGLQTTQNDAQRQRVPSAGFATRRVGGEFFQEPDYRRVLRVLRAELPNSGSRIVRASPGLSAVAAAPGDRPPKKETRAGLVARRAGNRGNDPEGQVRRVLRSA